MSGRWFRFYDEALDEPKVLRLSPEMRWHWVAVLAIACRYGGKLPSDEDVSLLLRTTVSHASEIVAELVSRGLIDATRSGAREPHNWRKRQFKSDVSTPRVKRFRKRFTAVAETPPEQSRAEAETETERARASHETRAREAAIVAEFHGRFWPAYPHKVGKPKALAAFVKARKSHDLPVIVSGLDRYTAEKPQDREWLNPATFLNQERFNDQPASPPTGNGTGRPEPANNALLREIVRQFAPGDGPGERQAGADGGLFDQPAGKAGDPGSTVDLPPGAYRRTG